MEPEVYNMMALGGLMLGKLILFSIIIYYCCRSRRQRTANTNDSADQTDDAHLKNDIPPTYSKVVLRVDPPEYIESVINEQINPELNKKWAEDLESGGVDPEIEEVIQRSRNNSITRTTSFEERPVGGGLGVPGVHGRRNTLSTVDEHRRAGHRQRTSSTTIPPVGAMWIGI